MTKLMIAARKSKIETIAWDCTIGCGEFNKTPDISRLATRLDRLPTEDEKKIFITAWNKHVQGALEEETLCE